jgi:hypothetical protein
MPASQTYERFPLGIVLLSNALSMSIYAVGIYVFATPGIWWVLLYVLYCLWMESRLLTKGCVDCYYYGKRCGLGRGRVCSLLFKQGVPGEFAKRELSWWDVAPDFMVSLLPLVAGIIQLVRGWSWLLAALLVILLVLSSVGNAIVRGQFACKYCRQREMGCPAEKLFAGRPGATDHTSHSSPG